MNNKTNNKPKPQTMTYYDWSEIEFYISNKYPTLTKSKNIWNMLTDSVDFHNDSMVNINFDNLKDGTSNKKEQNIWEAFQTEFGSEIDVWISWSRRLLKQVI